MASILSPHLRARLESFSLSSKRAVLGNRQGEHRSSKKGAGIEFSDYREYQRGDNPRAIDWGLFGRTDKLFIRRYQEEENVNLLIIVDGTSSMEFQREDVLRTAAAFLYLATRSHDSVTLSLPSSVAPVVLDGPRSIAKAELSLNAIKFAESQEQFYARVERELFRTKLPGLCLVLSDFLMSNDFAVKIASKISARRFDGSFVKLIPSEDPITNTKENIVEFIDVESGEKKLVQISESFKNSYEKARKEHEESIRKTASRYQLGFSSGNAKGDDEIIKLVSKSGIVEI